jgi:hypothetical protein
MSSSAVVGEPAPRFLLKADDRPPRELEQLGPGELESLRSAVESTLARVRAEQRATDREDFGFTCEWWPPD